MEELAAKIGQWTHAKERRLVDSTVRLVGELMLAWVQLVQASAVAARQAPVSHIVADGVFVGWRRWGTPAGSRRRLLERFESFRTVVSASRLAQLKEVFR
jgi:hypothetical protein